jgi:hypothetical protein
MKITLKEWKAWDFCGGSWHEWSRFSPAEIADVCGGPGVYVLALPEARAPLGRLVQSDPHSILDVGICGELSKYIPQLVRVATEAEAAHIEGWRPGSRKLLEKLKLEPSDLRLRWCSAESEDTEYAYSIERRILEGYYELFGELPPLNDNRGYETTSEKHVRSLIGRGKLDFRSVFERLKKDGFVDANELGLGPWSMESLGHDFDRLARFFFPEEPAVPVWSTNVSLGGTEWVRVIYNRDLSQERVVELVQRKHSEP